MLDGTGQPRPCTFKTAQHALLRGQMTRKLSFGLRDATQSSGSEYRPLLHEDLISTPALGLSASD